MLSYHPLSKKLEAFSIVIFMHAESSTFFETPWCNLLPSYQEQTDIKCISLIKWKSMQCYSI